MLRSLLLATVMLVVSSHAYSKILRVGYSGPQVSGVDYNNVNAAVQAAGAGDTIQLYQNASVGSSAVNKRLVFVGFGYSLETNAGLQAVASAPNVSGLYFNPGSENSVVQGVYGDFRITANNITISRCAGNVYLGYNQFGQSIPVENVAVVSSHITIHGQYGIVSNALISNSIIPYAYIINVNGLFVNNICTGVTNQFGSCVVKNNIFTYQFSCPSGNNCIFQNNIFRVGACNLTGSDNRFNVDMNNVFVNWNNGNFGSESNLALKTGSPAIGFGTDGSGKSTDAGIYGGEKGYVYKLSGIPAIPAIYQLTAPQLNASTNPYTITISVRSNN